MRYIAKGCAVCVRLINEAELMDSALAKTFARRLMSWVRGVGKNMPLADRPTGVK